MRTSRVIIVVVVVAIVGLLALFLYSSVASSSGPWVGGPEYPLQVGGQTGVVGQSCVNGTSTVYCIGGIDYNGASRNDVYSAQVSSSGMSSWSSDTTYPQTVGLQSCVSSAGYVYCVGGSYDDSGDDIASSYYAPLSSSGIGSWNSTTSYPVPIDSQSCVSSSGFIYCVGGENETNGLNATLISTNSAWYAPVSSGGIGAWAHTTAYSQAVSFETCAATSSDIFCVGGLDVNSNGVEDVYYAPLSSSGIGQWSSTTAYPSDEFGQTCIIYAGSHRLCGKQSPNGTSSATVAVYSASVSTSGLSAWHQAGNYPFGVETACAAAAGNLYCVGGYQDSSTITDSTYYVPVQSLLG